MLFPYTYVSHQMEKMQEFIDFIFYEVWCKAPGYGPFSLDLFLPNPDLYEVMNAFHYSDSQGSEFFLGHVQRIFELFTTLDDAQIEQFRQWYQANNDIEKVCANDSSISVARYADLPTKLNGIKDQLKSFFKNLYSYLNLAALKEKIGEIGDHYNEAFSGANRSGKCPFCGISDMKGPDHDYREAYDHYLPKALYPFNSVNFRNLAPACHECNSTYKKSKDPVHKGAGRRKAFYPYAMDAHDIEIAIDLNHSDIDRLVPADIQLTFGPAVVHEEIETWKDIYGIEERYKAKICRENDGKYWLMQVLDEWREDDRLPDDYLKTLSRQTARYPFAESNFLKKPFLEACRAAGILE
ncbi:MULTISPECIES: HNH endonuclease [Marinobacter]|jgi:hypothetical protein|uniref:HNH endonuclease n=1 Tax=Marinobacter TaxID=2742 RepID=UPI000FCA34E2|nr:MULTISPECIES: hypothetical protein [Marinobacter]MCZ4285382.1 hypothetical protein [Marinobacter salarius]MDM8181244.1 hypothetical protein [Marinobacter salarius]RUT76411.1 hypothetical protein EHM94_15185 [Marinobacter sp. NP-6]|tara:strand:- start:1911 stop:2969 length:1059 start_codon:yes stop_codon:yes gene_type:complete